MIYDVKDNLKQYKGISRYLDQAIDYLMRANFSGLAEGTYPLVSDDMYALLQSPQTKRRENALWISHRKYIELQVLLSGSEQIGFQNANMLTVSKDYDAKTDTTFYLDNHQGFFVNLVPDSFVICFPSDVYMPLVCSENPMVIKKVIVKVQAKDKGEIFYAKKPLNISCLKY